MRDDKAASAVSMIGGADGPTSVFLMGKKPGKRKFRQKLRKMAYAIRKKQVEKSIKANPHSMEQVIEYAKTKWGFVEIAKDSPDYKAEYEEMRSSFLIHYRPELLGELASTPQLEGQSEAALREFTQKLERQKKAAREIPAELFDVDCHILEKAENNTSVRLILETTQDYIGGSVVGNTQAFNKIFREIYRYYGVSQEDIDNRTRRYENLVRTLSLRERG